MIVRSILRVFRLALAIGALSGCSSHAVSSPNQEYSKAEGLRNRGDCQDALSNYADTIQRQPRYIAAYKGLAQCEETLLSFNLAARIATQAIALDPRDPSLYQLRSDIEFTQGAYDRTMAVAIADEIKSTEFLPKDPYAYLAVAAKLNDMLAFDDAVRMVDKALPLSENRAQLYLLRGSYYSNAREFAQAHKDFERARTLTHDDQDVASSYALDATAYLGEGDASRAKGAISKALERQPKSYDYAVGAVNVFTAAMDWEKAWEASNAAVRLAANQDQAVAARKMRADTALRLGKKSIAFTDYSWVIAHTSDAALKASLAKVIDRLDLQG